MENKEKEFEGFNIEVHAQYLKDLSFESPNSPISLIQQDPPQIGLDVNLNIQKYENENFEVILDITAKATDNKNNVVFMISVSYAGLFDLSKVPEEYHQNVLTIYCPNLLFPYVRSIISDSVREGGFPPLLLKPIDFTKLYNTNNNFQ